MSVEPPMEDNVQLGSDERMWGMLCHLLALAGFIGIPFGHIIGPLVIWLMKKEQYAFVNDQGKEALNFQISMTIYIAIAAILIFVLIGFVLMGALAIIDIVLIIVASIAANEGKAYRYPIAIRFIK